MNPSLQFGRTKSLLATVALLAMSIPQTASAAVIFQSVGDIADSTKYTAAWCSGCSGTFRVFDQFTLSGTANITGFSVVLDGFAAQWGQGLNFSIWTIGTGAQPDTQLFSQSLGDADFTTQAGDFGSIIATTDDVVGLSLDAGTYYVSFYNTNLSVWGYNGGGGKLLQQGNKFHDGTSAAFILNGETHSTVPEPTSLALVGLAVLGAAGATRRRS